MTSDLILHRAKNYPYERADQSFLFENGEIRALPDDLQALTDGHHPVLAFGSNAAPEQLQRKYRDWPEVRFLVSKVVLHHYDVVYSAHLTSYGAVPATLAPSQDTALDTWITWLDDEQLHHMHKTEMGAGGGADVNYAYGLLQDVSLSVPDIGEVLAEIGVYLSNYGALAIADAPLAFSKIDAQARIFEARDKLSVLETLRESLAPDQSLDHFIHRIVEDPDSRARWGNRLKAVAHPLVFPKFTTLTA